MCEGDNVLKSIYFCFLSQVGGKFTYTVLANHMNAFGRIAVCGAIEQYNTKPEDLPKG